MEPNIIFLVVLHTPQPDLPKLFDRRFLEKTLFLRRKFIFWLSANTLLVATNRRLNAMNHMGNFPFINNPWMIWGSVFGALIVYWALAASTFS